MSNNKHWVTRTIIYAPEEKSTLIQWSAVNREQTFGVHAWLKVVIKDGELRDGYPYGGIEYHRANRPEWGEDRPTHSHCQWLDKPCWHDGSSLQAEQYAKEFAYWMADCPTGLCRITHAIAMMDQTMFNLIQSRLDVMIEESKQKEATP